MDCIAICKGYEKAWQQGHITCAEYHGLLNYILRRLYEQDRTAQH